MSNVQDSIDAAVSAINAMVSDLSDKLDKLNTKPADDGADTSKLDDAVASLKDMSGKLDDATKDDSSTAPVGPSFPGTVSPAPVVGTPNVPADAGNPADGDVKNPDGSLKNPEADAMNAAGKGDTAKVDQAKDDAAAQAADHANDFKGVDTAGNVL